MRALLAFAARSLPCVALLVAALPACRSTAPYTWVDELPAQHLKPPPYKVLPGDRLAVNVWNQPALSGEVLVRPDGRITLPLIGDVQAVGLTLSAVAEEITRRLQGLVVEPHVTVSLVSTREASVSVVGEVREAGTFPLRPGEGVLELLARAGGLSEFADKDRIFILRRSEGLRVRFTFDKLTRAEGPGTQFVLQDGDLIVVE